MRFEVTIPTTSRIRFIRFVRWFLSPSLSGDFFTLEEAKNIYEEHRSQNYATFLGPRNFNHIDQIINYIRSCHFGHPCRVELALDRIRDIEEFEEIINQ